MVSIVTVASFEQFLKHTPDIYRKLMDVCYKSVILRKFWCFIVYLIIRSMYDSTNEHTNVQAGNIFIWKEVRVGVIYWNSTSQEHPTRIQLKTT